MDFIEQITQRKASTYDSWLRVLLSYAMGGIFFILFLDYCTLTASGKELVNKVKQEIKDCLSEIDFRSFIKPVLFMFGIYLLGIFTIIRANFSYLDDVGITAVGYREWFNWSRYVNQFLSYFIHPEINITDNSPFPQLLTILLFAISSVFLVYIVGKGKITVSRLLACLPLGLTPYFLETLSYKFGCIFGALSILLCIVPFLFINRKKAFVFCSVMSLLAMYMTLQAVAGIYMLIVIILCFQDWNSREKSNKEILEFLGLSVLSFCLAVLLFKLFLLKPADYYGTTAIHPVSQIITGIFSNIKAYAMIIYKDFSIIWIILIIVIMFFFMLKSMYQSKQKKLLSFFVSLSVIVISFISSYGIYLLLQIPFLFPRALISFGVFLAIICIFVVSEFKKTAIIPVIALNWCFFVFSFSYGNALSDQARYAEFRISILLNDLSKLYPNADRDVMSIQLDNSIDFTPVVKNIAKHNPVIKRLVPKRLGGDNVWEYYYYLEHFNFIRFNKTNFPDEKKTSIDFNTLNFPVVLDSYYHTIKSDRNRVLVQLKH